MLIRDIFTKIYGGKESFNASDLKDFLRRQSLKKMSTNKGKMTHVIPLKTSTNCKNPPTKPKKPKTIQSHIALREAWIKCYDSS